MRKKNQNAMTESVTKNLLERFSCYLVGRGKKVSGHKILLESLFMLREKNNGRTKTKTILNLPLQRDLLRKIEDRLSKKRKDSSFINKAQQKNTTFQKSQLADNFAQKSFSKNDAFSLDKNIDTKNIVHNLSSFKSHFTEKIKEKAKKTTILTLPIQKKMEPVNDQQLVLKPMIFEKLLNKSICQLCVDNVKPILETRKIRKGRITYRVPKISCLQRQEGKAIALLIENALSLRKNEFKRSASFTLNPTVKGNNTAVSSSTLGKTSSKILPKTELLALSKMQARTTNIAVDNTHNITKDPSLIKKTNSNTPYLSSFVAKDYNSFFQKQSKSYSIKRCLSEELFDSANGNGESIEKKKQLHQFALQNRANLHFRWW